MYYIAMFVTSLLYNEEQQKGMKYIEISSNE